MLWILDGHAFANWRNAVVIFIKGGRNTLSTYSFYEPRNLPELLTAQSNMQERLVMQHFCRVMS